MKNIQLYLIFITSLLLAVVLLFGYFISENTRGNSSANIENKKIISFCAKEITDANRVYFNYPQFDKKSGAYDKINILITEFVTSALYELCNGNFAGNINDYPEDWGWNNRDYNIQAIKVDYKVMRNDKDYFSVTFEGLCNNKNAAHPINYFTSLIIDVSNCKLVRLNDLCLIDSDFTNTIQDVFRAQINDGLTERTGTPLNDIPIFSEAVFSSLDRIEDLGKADNNSGYHSFLTDTALGISVPLSYSLGDHFEILINYNKLIEIGDRLN